MDTIFAVSSGAPPAAIAVVRVSGPVAMDVARRLSGKAVLPRRQAVLRALRNADGELLDRALVLAFDGPNTATGEDLLELHLHGGRAVVRGVLSALAAMPTLRAAEPGEFTRRALANGRIDLSEAEGLADLLSAETDTQRRLALRTADGAVRRQVEQWRVELLDLAAQVEALLDHSDEEDVVSSVGQGQGPLSARAQALGAQLAAVASRPSTERLRDGLRVVLAGPPNAGKSTLLNALAERDVAIVTPIAGTTRDRIEAPVMRGGHAYLLTDTAGLTDEPGDEVESIGVDRAREALAGADILLWLGDESPPGHPAIIWVWARADMPGREVAGTADLAVSARTGAGMEALWHRLAEFADRLLPPIDLLALNGRQRTLVAQAAQALTQAGSQTDLLLMAEELRSARSNLDAVTGRAGVEEMLDSLFGRFCIGK